MTETLPLDGRIALVTGATRGIGRASALALAKAGAHVVAVGRSQGALEELDDEIKTATGKAAAEAFTARLTIDITPELRGRIKVAAFRRGVTVAVMLRELLVREFPPTKGDQP